MGLVTDVEQDAFDTDDPPAGFKLGEPIALEDLLALPPDGRRWGRDRVGRLCLLSPESAYGHHRPLAKLVTFLARSLADPAEVYTEPGLALPVLRKLGGALVPESKLGPRSIEPDVAVFRGAPRALPSERWASKCFRTDELALAIEVLSRRTFRAELGLGRADQVDRWTSYRLSGVPELWLINVDAGRPCPLPPGSGLFLRNAGGAWEPLPVEGAVFADGQVHGFRPLAAGVVRSTIPGLTLDLTAFWREVAPPT